MIKILQRLKKRLLYRFFREELSAYREEMDDHLLAINENTNEIQANYEYLCELDTKLNKLYERLDEMSMFMGLHPQQNHAAIPAEQAQTHYLNLTTNEKEVFLVLYTLEEEMAVTYKDIAQRLHYSDSLVMNYITNLISRGVPIIRHYVNNEAHLRLDPKFKNLQAKQNIVGINEAISAELIS